MVPAQRLISALAVLYAVLVVAQAAGQPSLRDVLNKRPSAVSTASVQDDSYGYDNYGLETKEICLQETEQKVCTWVNNCNADNAVASTSAATSPSCLIGQLWTSDFACCQERNYGYDAPSGLRNTQLWAGASSIGTCDWTVLYSDVNTLGQQLSITVGGATTTYPGGEQAAITNNIWKLGTVWATCYLGPESESCGGPLCDRMVMSMQGTAYRALKAYSHWGPSGTQDPTCFEANGPEGPNRTVSLGAAVPGFTGRIGSRSIRRGVRSADNNPTAELQYNTGGYYHGHDNNEQDVFQGEATIFMGVITSLAGQRKERWEEGVFEYVPYFQLSTVDSTTGATINQPITTGLDASVPWVRDKTYKLTFYKAGKY